MQLRLANINQSQIWLEILSLTVHGQVTLPGY